MFVTRLIQKQVGSKWETKIHSPLHLIAEFIVVFINLGGKKWLEMVEVILTQEEADILIGAEKSRVNDDVWQFPTPGDSINIPLISSQNSEEYILDIRKGRIKLSQATLQNRVRKSIVLLRLDLDGPPGTGSV